MFERLTADKVYLNSIRFGIQVNFPPHCGHEKAKEVDDFVKNVFDRLAAYEDSGLSPDEVLELKEKYETEKTNSEATYTIMCGLTEEVERLKKCLAEYEQVKAEGRLVALPCDGRLMVLPCKVGDTVYEIVDSVDVPYVRQEKVIAIELWNKNGAITMFIRTLYGLFEFDKTVFLTREEAEAALQKEAQHE